METLQRNTLVKDDLSKNLDKILIFIRKEFQITFFNFYFKLFFGL